MPILNLKTGSQKGFVPCLCFALILPTLSCGRFGFFPALDSHDQSLYRLSDGSVQGDQPYQEFSLSDGRKDGALKDSATESSNNDSVMPTTYMLTAGLNHACAIQNGQLFCWGENEDGQLGLGDYNDRSTPTLVMNSQWAQLAKSGDSYHTCAIQTDQSLWCWGRNLHGQLGLGDSGSGTNRATPQKLPYQNWVEVAMAEAHSCGIRQDQSLWCWGHNDEGELGMGAGDRQMRTTPEQVSKGSLWKDVSLGQGSTLAIQADGTLWGWGRNTQYQLGLGHNSPEQYQSPQQAGGQSNWSYLAAGQFYSVALDDALKLWAWGENFFGQLGQGDVDTYPSITKVGNEHWISLSTQWFHTCAVRKDHSLWCWGRNVEGQLGTGGTDDYLSSPQKVSTDTDWQQVVVGHFFSCAMKLDGRVYCTGDNASGQLGLGHLDRRNVFTLVSF